MERHTWISVYIYNFRYEIEEEKEIPVRYITIHWPISSAVIFFINFKCNVKTVILELTSILFVINKCVTTN
jgi:hypothetical protein